MAVKGYLSSLTANAPKGVLQNRRQLLAKLLHTFCSVAAETVAVTLQGFAEPLQMYADQILDFAVVYL